MKYNFNLTYLLEFVLLFFNIAYAKNDKTLSNVDNEISNGDDYYLIYVNNKYGEYHVFSDSKNQKREESQVFVESLLDKINTLIINNKDTYQNPEKLDEIKEEFQLRKRNNNENQTSYTSDETDYVYPISSVNERVVLYSFLSKPLAETICSGKNIIGCSPNKTTLGINHYYNIDDILEDTLWKEVEIQEDADLHLSLISQGKYDENLINEYDTNYYYPKSSGKDIDIVILDSSFHFDYFEFSNTDNRTVKCAGNVENGRVLTDNIDYFCGNSSFYHGEVVSDTVGGLKHGVAKNANIYGVSVPTDEFGQIEDSDVLAGLQFIYENLIRPHKTVINLSLGGADSGDSIYSIQLKAVINAITLKGGIVVAAAGNEGLNISYLSYMYIPCQYENVICAGGISNKKGGDLSKVYNVDFYSNYGKGVDVYAPFQVFTEILKNHQVTEVLEMGTSFSTPIVVGIIATIMGENPDVVYSKDSMNKKLYEYGQNEIIKFETGEGILANNGKHIVYSMDDQYNGCGIYAGNRACIDEEIEE